MRIIARSTLVSYVESRAGHKSHAGLKASVEAWYAEARRASWQSMADIKKMYGTSSPVTADRIVFNIKGNDYRLVVAIDFEKQIAWIKWIGTHAEYDRIDVREVGPWQISM